jgi:16S rRNA (guanine966-N2)-methyltransferase
MALGQIRIIGGQWRGRKIQVPTGPDLRPTPDRVRETLFNWLAPVIQGTHCLDPFAGSGALGFEALSRGAASVVMVDQSLAITKILQDQADIFKTQHADIYRAQAPEQLKQPQHLFDIVFLDPPFKENLLLPTCFYLEEKKFLAKHALIYLESSVALEESDLPSHWKMIKKKKAGQVTYHLAERRE